MVGFNRLNYGFSKWKFDDLRFYRKWEGGLKITVHQLITLWNYNFLFTSLAKNDRFELLPVFRVLPITKTFIILLEIKRLFLKKNFETNNSKAVAAFFGKG